MKSMGLALLMALPTANESTGASASLKMPMRSTSSPPETTILTWPWPCLVEARADLLDEVGSHPPPLGGRVEPNAPQPIAERFRDAQRLLRLVLEGVDQRDARHVRIDVAIERLDSRTVSPKISTRACGIVPVG